MDQATRKGRFLVLDGLADSSVEETYEIRIICTIYTYWLNAVTWPMSYSIRYVGDDKNPTYIYIYMPHTYYLPTCLLAYVLVY